MAAQPEATTAFEAMTPSLDIPAHGTPDAAAFACSTAASGPIVAGGKTSAKLADPLNPSSAWRTASCTASGPSATPDAAKPALSVDVIPTRTLDHRVRAVTCAAA